LYWFVRYDGVAVATTVVVILVVMIVVLRSGRIGRGRGAAELAVVAGWQNFCGKGRQNRQCTLFEGEGVRVGVYYGKVGWVTVEWSV